MAAQQAAAWFDAHGDVQDFRVAVVDLNGIWRGKRLPVAQAGKVFGDGVRMPLSVSAVDVWGADVADSPLVFESGDGDGIARPTGRGVLPVDWLAQPSALVPLMLETETGTPSPVDPRQVLAGVRGRYRAAGLVPVSAMELEFYLVDPKTPRPRPPRAPQTGRRLSGEAILSLAELDEFEGFFADLYATCARYGVQADAAIAESGTGQFEVNLLHHDDPLKVADDAVLFKYIAKGVARRHGFAASFMAKPYVGLAGSGLHVHFSVLDADGANIFDDGSDAGSDTLRHGVAGVLGAMPECGLVFAPHRNSYRRLAPGSHAPTGICWGYENRTAAVRIPGGSPKARRIEHRVAGADANPYLVLAAVLGAALDGIEAGKMPVEPVTGDAYSLDLEQISTDWDHATTRFAAGTETQRIFPDMMRTVYVQMKRQEQQRFAARMTGFELGTYLETV